MNKKQTTFQKLLSMSFNAVQVTLQNIEHKNGSTWAYSNRKPSKKATIFGNSTVNATLSILDLSKERTTSTTSIKDGLLVTIWLNDCDQVEADMYADKFGTDAIVLVDDSGNGELVSYSQADAMIGEQATPPAPVDGADAQQLNA
tara:strand:- start:87 stop:521 length:435 start_codon:yes stop_codon:yes gene_type:complete